MRLQSFARLALVAAFGLTCAACAKTVGQAAGTVVGGAAFAVLKGGSYAGRTVKGAANGVHDEFAKKKDQKVAANTR